MAPISGTFVQLLVDSHGEWSEEQWRVFFGYLEKLKISQLFLQWTVNGDVAFFPSETFQSVNSPPLEKILKLAERFNVKISVGLVHDPDYWRKIEGKPEHVRNYLAGLLKKSSRTVDQLAPLVQQYKSFHGWYITEEIDDINWRQPEKRNLLFSYLKTLSGKLEQLTPGRPIAISGFSNGHISIDEFASFWDSLLKQTEINLAFFQDGIGANKLTLNNLPVYLQAFKAVTANNRTKMGVIIEIFRQTHGYPLDDKPFQAVPARMERVNQQRIVASEFSRNLIAFSIPEYMTPLAGAQAELLYQSYLLETENKLDQQGQVRSLDQNP